MDHTLPSTVGDADHTLHTTVEEGHTHDLAPRTADRQSAGVIDTIRTAHLITAIIEAVTAPSLKAFLQEHTGIHGGATHAASLQGAPPGEDIHPVFPHIGGGATL